MAMWGSSANGSLLVETGFERREKCDRAFCPGYAAVVLYRVRSTSRLIGLIVRPGAGNLMPIQHGPAMVWRCSCCAGNEARHTLTYCANASWCHQAMLKRRLSAARGWPQPSRLVYGDRRRHGKYCGGLAGWKKQAQIISAGKAGWG